jgi:hypothetical protein
VRIPIMSILLIALCATSLQATAVKVEIKKDGDQFVLLRGGEPFYIKGAGGDWHLDRLAAYGGNSVRTWSAGNALEILDKAQAQGLTVMLGFWVQHERHGFDYDNKAAVEKQFNKFRDIVIQVKDHPALLLYGIGNEVNHQYSNMKVWDAIQEVAHMCHELDSSHLTTTVVAGMGKREISEIKQKCPDIDLLSCNLYGPLGRAPEMIRDSGWPGAYIITEWGPTGWWESPKTSWGQPIEETSSAKAKVYGDRYKKSMGRDTKKCLGSYVFYWSQKQERTPTWFSLFLKTGEETEVIDTMHYLWSGTWPANRAPHIDHLHVNGRDAHSSVKVAAGREFVAAAQVTDPDKDTLRYVWQVVPESTDLKTGGDRESEPKPLPGLVKSQQGTNATIKAPARPGSYRLFVYAYDGHNNVATGNIPILVE